MRETMAHLVAKYEYRKCTSVGNTKIMFCYQTLTCSNARNCEWRILLKYWKGKESKLDLVHTMHANTVFLPSAQDGDC